MTWIRFAAGAAVVTVVVVVLHVAPLPLVRVTSLREILNVTHVLGFTVLSYWTVIILKDKRGWISSAEIRPFVAAAVLLSALAVLSEVAQGLTGRNPSIGDLIRDGLGITAGLCLVLLKGRRSILRICLVGVAVFAIGLGLYSPGRVILSRAIAAFRLPVLLSFDYGFESLLMEGSNASVERVPVPSEWPIAGFAALVTPAEQGANPGVTFYGLPKDWSEYRELNFVVAAVDSKLSRITIRVHDTEHNHNYSDRFNRAISIGTEPRRVRISLTEIQAAPSNRQLDLSSVDGIIIFEPGSSAGAFLLDDLKLQ